MSPNVSDRPRRKEIALWVVVISAMRRKESAGYHGRSQKYMRVSAGQEDRCQGGFARENACDVSVDDVGRCP